MSIFKVVSYKSHSTGLYGLQDVLTYIRRATATQTAYIYGVNVSEFDPFTEMALVKAAYNQSRGKMFNHYILNPEPEDCCPSLLLRLWAAGQEITKYISRFHGAYQVIFAVHFDCDYPHLHFIANNIDYETGKRFDLGLKRLCELKKAISVILIQYGISKVRQGKSHKYHK